MSWQIVALVGAILVVALAAIAWAAARLDPEVYYPAEIGEDEYPAEIGED